jgi:hypothetical protein
MGRTEHHTDRDTPVKLIVHVLPFVDGDYDEGGAYWGGAGEPVWRALEPDGDVEFFLRAKDRWEALAQVREQYPNATIVDTPRERWFEEFVMGYETAALWSSTGTDPTLPEGEQEVEGMEGYELAPETAAAFREECKDFCDFAEPQLLAAMQINGYSPGRAGHDFWLTRCGHGAGYWDRDELEAEGLGEKLTAAADSAGSRDLYIGDDGLVYQS